MNYTVETFKNEVMSRIGEHDPFKIFFEITGESGSPDQGHSINFTLYTSLHKYHIKASEGIPADSEGKEKPSYLGCVMENRAPYPGETHLRGTDLPDGLFNAETWHNILINILNHELQSIFQKQPIKTVIEQTQEG